MEETNNMMNSNQELAAQNEEQVKDVELKSEVENSDIKEEDALVEGVEMEQEIDEEDAVEIEEQKLPDFNKFSLEELVSEANKVINSYVFGESKKVIDIIKNTFYIKLNAEQEAAKEAFLANEENKIEDYSPAPNPHEETFKELLKVFKNKRAEALAQLEKEKENNYKLKTEIVDEIMNLVNSTEHFNTVYKNFKDLQDKWKGIKQVPSSKLKELNSKYQFALNQFYDYLKINKELRELDLRKNQENKELLCKRAEELVNLDNAKSAFVELQDLHQRWKDIGPVLDENREALWERFKEATKEVNNKFQDYQTKLKEVREENLVKKTEICVKVEEAIEGTYTSPKEWDEGSKVIENLQKEWRKIGMVPSKNNDEIYKRFKTSCDQFFQLKNEYFKSLKSKQRDNLDLKIKLIEQVELLAEDTNWKDTTNKIIKIQKEWKQIGPVPKKKSDAVWKRFRAACDVFFNNKDQHFKSIHGDEKENLEKKQALIEEIEKFTHTEDVKANLKTLKDFQNAWGEIGFVPIKNKNDIQERYRLAINKQFDALDIDAEERDLSRLKVKLDGYIESPNAQKLIFGERNKLVTRIKKVETDIQQLENNIGFFSSGTAKGLLKEYENKISVNKKNLKALQEKIRLIDKYIAD
jgi:hypothetical protein